ncbi:MAG: hypothetical protein AB1921_00135 [Thermodesulfobacteriota bacterium]
MESKKIAAAMAGVMEYLKTEQEQAALAAPPPAQAFSAWALSGRQAMMQMRNLMQMRAIRVVGR